MIPILHLAALVIAAGLLVWAGVSDLLRYRIPNLASLGLVLVFGLFAVTLPEPALIAQQIDLAGFSAHGTVSYKLPDPAIDWLRNLQIGGIALVLGLFAFFRGWAGGGDGKLFAAVALWAGPEQILPAVLLMSLIGGVLAAAQLLTVQQSRAKAAGAGLLSVGRPSRADLSEAPVPYGVAISGAGLYVLWGLAAPLF